MHSALAEHAGIGRRSRSRPVYSTSIVSTTTGAVFNGVNVTIAEPRATTRKRNCCVGPPGFGGPSLVISTNVTAEPKTVGGLAYSPMPPPQRRTSTTPPTPVVTVSVDTGSDRDDVIGAAGDADKHCETRDAAAEKG